MTLLKCVLLLSCLSGCFCQRDCSGVDCPVLDNCIEEALESGACCASCMQTGCSCEGYQYYDCVNAGFENGKVPDGDSYFVDYGSTECSCPAGGGRISCHFISCPDIPANCIEVSEPSEAGCVECQRVGCVQSGDKYEAGHSFQIDPCQVCHCPNNGGKLMCYPVPDCDPRLAHKPMLSTPTEDNARGNQNDPYGLRRRDPAERFSEPDRPSPRDSLSLFKPAGEMDEGDFDDYDDARTGLPEPTSESPAWPARTSPLPGVVSPSPPDGPPPPLAHGTGWKLELRERYGVYKQTTDGPTAPGAGTTGPSVTEDATATWQRSPDVQTHTERAPGRKTYPLYLPKGPESKMNPLHLLTFPLRVIESQTQAQTAPQSVILPIHSITGTDSPINPESGLDTPINTERGSVTRTRPHNPFKGTESQTHPHHPFRSSDTRTPSQHPFQSPERPLYPHRASSGSERQFQHRSGPERQTPHLQKPTHTLISSDGEANSERTESMDVRQPEGDEMDEPELEAGRGVEERALSFKDGAGPGGTVSPRNAGSGPPESGAHGGSAGVSDGAGPAQGGVATAVADGVESPARPQLHTVPMVPSGPTSPPPPMRQPDKTLFDSHREDAAVEGEEEEWEEEEGNNDPVFTPKSEEGPGAFAQGLARSCCEVGQKMAAENGHCDHVPRLNHDKLSMCSVAQKQCCSGFLAEAQCSAGVTAARAGGTCAVDGGDTCKDDSYQVCCSCCALGLRLRAEGGACDAHRYLGHPCGHVFLACCEEEEGAGRPAPRRKEEPRPTPSPRRVLDSRFPKEAFSVDGPDEAANHVEPPETADECRLRQGQLCQHTCTDTRASYSCGCHPGYSLQPDGHSCVPVSPEEDNKVREDDRGGTPVAAAAATTTGRPGHLQPCAGNGPCMQQCTVVAGQARCSCFPGFSLMTDGHTCEDVNECVTTTPRCAPGERCVNTVGSFVCERAEPAATCPSGYQRRDGVCQDIDECATRHHNCGAGFTCRNTDGAFLCDPQQKCLPGFTQDSHGNCIDVDECSGRSEPECGAGFSCVNTVGSYACRGKAVACGRGYHAAGPDGDRCTDVDECQTGAHRCGEGQICHNLPGRYRCDCQTGYQYDATRQACTDVDECWRRPGRPCAQTCENIPGSYRCSCTAGFSLAADGKSCEDLNECDQDPCSQECANVFGSYQCYCRQGFYLKEDGHTCDDIDECSQSVGNLCAFQCVNVPGSYRCACPARGYAMSANGHTCKDVDECTTGSHNCSMAQTCYNIQGSFRCLSFDCPQNYRKVSDTRCERKSCPANSVECQNSALRITYYQLSFQTNILTPAQIFRIGPSPTYPGDHVVVGVVKGDEEGYFSTRKLNGFTGAVYLQRQVRRPRDFLIDVEMRLLRQGSLTSFLARIYIFITTSSV